MTDRLGEALADYDKWIADDRHTLPLETFTEVAAAARAWHAITHPDYEAALSDLLELVPDAVLADAVRVVDAALVWEKQ